MTPEDGALAGTGAAGGPIVEGERLRISPEGMIRRTVDLLANGVVEVRVADGATLGILR